MVLPSLLFVFIAFVLGISSATDTIPDYQRESMLNAANYPSVVTIGFVLPSENLTDSKTRESLREYLAVKAIGGNATTNMPGLPYRLRVNPIYATHASIGNLVKALFCSRAAEGTNALFVLVDKAVQGDAGTRMANFITTIANKAGIPTFTWSSQSNELEEFNYSDDENHAIMLASPTKNQAKAIFAFLKTYQWRRFSIVVSTQTPGYRQFLDQLGRSANFDEPSYSRFSFDSHQSHMSGRIIRTVKLSNHSKESIQNELMTLRDSTDTRIIVLFADQTNADNIFIQARMLGMTSGEYLWICGKPVLGDHGENRRPSMNIVPGTIVVTYSSSIEIQHEALKTATQIWSDAMEKFSRIPKLGIDYLVPPSNCDGSRMKTWDRGKELFNILRSQPIKFFDQPEVKFDEDGLADIGSIRVLNLDQQREWRKIGEWTSNNGLLMDDITWPAGPGKPPSGRTDSAIVRIATLEEPPVRL